MKLSSLTLAAIAVAAVSGTAIAQDFPTRPIQLVVPFGQGGATDQVARMIVPALEEELGQPVVIINQPGAGGAVGLANLAVARPDGYTIAVGSDSTLGARPIMDSSSYTADSFEMIATLVDIPSGIAVRADSPYETLDDLVEALRTEPLTWSGSGIGSGPHLAAAVFLGQNDLQNTYVNSSSGQEAMVKLLSGEIEFLSGGGSNFPPMFDENGNSDIRVLGLAAEERWEYMPDVPTYREQGYDYLRSQWFGLVAPAGTPEVAVTKITQAVEKALADPEFQERLASFYFAPYYLNPEEMRAQVAAEAEEFRPILEEVGLAE
ncbi:tripartite tricarboxylate transporter substrate binding protein [Arsenicitalea aurantiaca]|uniref:Tripartite tricarboxylate transporter substrate binding protein n=1 Tax=Arsenicitalea aurantiaca TaxID=1783274 RepID=A0A433XKV2_9HYPH|nr:tripartite tricarboxylate transporter substrate binding protein [Arsenicitalea aurantiaca]RUT34681.1 tripartite tricarboxylate transporter substrate binding protein [Arsenicitalea aurantiaca]